MTLRGVNTELGPCTVDDEIVNWRYAGECWTHAKARLAHEDPNDMVPVDIDPAVRAILEGDVDPGVDPSETSP